MKKVFVALFLVASLFVVSLSVFAYDASHSSGLCEGDVLVFNGEEYVVYFTGDGEAHLAKDGIMLLGSTCPDGRPHQYKVQPGTSVKQTKINNNSTYCYWERSYIRSTCTRCGDTIASLSSEKQKKHTFKLFGKECQNVVNGVKCPFKKS
ncbi:hypothetical protein [Gemmiger sp. An194]|uniref:hypothetical protein n=1 Tax=Gemmiger sp. An194 TaxID=1965582 RepID=UPI00117A66AA|nr:hypothetical protein [Gemmiger sp. An194]